MTHPVLGRLRVASPCSADWSAMQGDERSRHCEACGLRVFHLSAMTTDEIVALTHPDTGTPSNGTPAGRTCVRFYRRADGTVLTADCPVGRADVRRTRVRRVGMAAALLALWAASERAVGAVWGLVAEAPMARHLAFIPPPDDGDWIMGDMVAEPPLDELGYTEIAVPPQPPTDAPL